ncbi:MAG: sulfotransferase, partial [Pseudomonadota bacterium]
MSERRPPLIILCPMRSFSSVVCAVLGQHPQTYGLPEVNLFIADTVGELMNAHASRPHGAHGLLRTLAQLEHDEQTEESVAAVQRWLDERSDWTTQQLFEHILDGVAPKIAVDKTPRTVLSPAYLERAYEMFPDASFLHLTRHPRSTGKSLLNNLKRNSEWGGTFDADRVDPENIWLRAHTNITEFASTLPEGQCLR